MSFWLSKKYIGHLYIFLVALLFALVGIFTKYTSDAVSPYSIWFYRVILWFFTIIGVLLLSKKQITKPTTSILLHAIILSIFFSASIAGYILSFKYSSIAQATLLWSTTPFFVIIIWSLFFRERITMNMITTLLIASSWILFLIPLSSTIWDTTGNLLALWSALSFGAFTLFLNKFEKRLDISLLFWIFLISSFLLSPFVVIHGIWDLHSSWLYILSMGIWSTWLAYFLFTLWVHRIHSSSSSIIIMMTVPTISIFLWYFFLGETITTNTIRWGALLLIAWLFFELSTYQIFSHKHITTKSSLPTKKPLSTNNPQIDHS